MAAPLPHTPLPQESTPQSRRKSSDRSAQENPYPVSTASLRVLAHPLRSRLLSELRTLGPATGSELARSLGTNSGATSYHLRRLEEAGLVSDTGEGTGRRRVWAAQSDGRAVEHIEADENDEAAAEWLTRDYIQHFSGKAQGWITQASDWSPTWQEVAGLDDQLVLVTDEQLGELRLRIHELLNRYRRLGAGNPHAKRVTFYTCALPVDPPGQATRSAPQS